MVLAALEQPDSGITLAQHSQLLFKLLGCVHLQEFCGDPDVEAVGTMPNSVHLGDVPVPPELARVELSSASLGTGRDPLGVGALQEDPTNSFWKEKSCGLNLLEGYLEVNISVHPGLVILDDPAPLLTGEFSGLCVLFVVPVVP